MMLMMAQGILSRQHKQEIISEMTASLPTSYPRMPRHIIKQDDSPIGGVSARPLGGSGSSVLLVAGGLSFWQLATPRIANIIWNEARMIYCILLKAQISFDCPELLQHRELNEQRQREKSN